MTALEASAAFLGVILLLGGLLWLAGRDYRRCRARAREHLLMYAPYHERVER